MLKDIIIRFIKYILSKLDKPVKEIEMGRPRKNPLPTPPVAPVEVKPEVVLPSEPIKTVDLNNVAYSIARNPVNQRWVVLSIKYDFATKTVGEIKVIEESLDRIDVLHRYQVLSGSEFFSEI